MCFLKYLLQRNCKEVLLCKYQIPEKNCRNNYFSNKVSIVIKFNTLKIIGLLINERVKNLKSVMNVIKGITEQFRLERTSGNHLVHFSTGSRAMLSFSSNLKVGSVCSGSCPTLFRTPPSTELSILWTICCGA